MADQDLGAGLFLRGRGSMEVATESRLNTGPISKELLTREREREREKHKNFHQ